MSKHTPGPWENSGRVPQPGIPHSSVTAKTLIARVYSEAYGDRAQEDANARLIAAAPDLLKALQALDAHWLEAAPPPHPDKSQQEPRFLSEDTLDVWRAARAAISRATGRHP